jgi:hypothetical protein
MADSPIGRATTNDLRQKRPERSGIGDRPGIDDVRKRLDRPNDRGTGGEARTLPGVSRPAGEGLKWPRQDVNRESFPRGHFDPKDRPSMRVITPGKPQTSIGGTGPAKPGHRGFVEQVKAGELNHLTRGAVAKDVKLDEQYRLSEKGDVARQWGLAKPGKRVVAAEVVRGGSFAPKPDPAGHGPGPAHDRHDDHRDDHRKGPHGYRHSFPHHGPVHAHFTNFCFHIDYCGPGYYPAQCWYPHWSPWVSWSWHYHCHPVWDPRPVWCRPVVYVAAPVWVYWQVPVWQPLPVVACGTWVDVPPPPAPVAVAAVAPEQFDLQLLAVRFVDPGHPEENLGPRFRVWFRNNSNRPIVQPFNVILLASANDQLNVALPQAGVRVNAVEAGDMQSVDIRLPVEVNSMGVGPDGKQVPFSTLNVLVDANREINETNRTNNGVKVARIDVLPVDPATFEVQPKAAASGGEVLLAGEGFGPEPGQVLIHLGGIEMQGEILGWYDLGVRLSLPNLPLAGPTEAELIVLRGDGAAANPMKITLTPAVAGQQPAAEAGPQLIGPAVDLK